MTAPAPSDGRPDRPRLPARAWLLLILGLVLATYPAWRLLVFEPDPPLDALLRLRC